MKPRLMIVDDASDQGKTGIELLKDLKANPLTKKIPVCLFSNSNFESDVREAYESVVSFYFKKPLGLTELKTSIECFTGVFFKYASF